MSKSQQEVLKERFHRFLHRRKDDGKVVDEIARQFRSRGWTVYAFGGTPRGVHDSGSIYRPRDIDLVFDDSNFESFESAYEKYIIRRNSFGGLKLKKENVVIDAWPLSATWAFRNGYIKNPSWETLPSTTFLNIDGIIIEFAPKVLKKRKIFECDFFEGWNSRMLDINLEPNPFPSVCVARTLTISKRFGFLISTRLALYLYKILGNIALSAIENIQKKHYGKVNFDLIELREIRNKLHAYLSGKTINPLELFPSRLTQPDLFETLNQSPRLNCAELSPEVRSFIKLSNEDVRESFFENLIDTGSEFIGAIKHGLTNKRGQRINRKKSRLT